jgi:5-methylcytosine-specific restriction endonuclease McrA
MPKRRDWTAARAKVEADNHGRCRVCRTAGVDAAHVIPRSINPTETNMGADAVVGLCRRCHTSYDSHQLDLLPYLTIDEQVHATRMAGSIERARQMITGGRA